VPSPEAEQRKGAEENARKNERTSPDSVTASKKSIKADTASVDSSNPASVVSEDSVLTSTLDKSNNDTLVVIL
jgi:hypothetical protein